MIDALFFERKKKTKKEKKCKFDGPFSVQDPNCFSILLMQVLHLKLLFSQGFELTNRVRVSHTVGSACLYTT